jgi:hypothetical protein
MKLEEELMKSWQEIGFEIEITGDGSPSLRMLELVNPDKPFGESMHHSGGACAETNLIYGEPIKETLAQVQAPHFMIVGLGLGYIEMVIAREALLAGLSPADLPMITSFESVPELRQFFMQWLRGSSELHPEVTATYDQVVQSVLNETSLDAPQIKNFLLSYFTKDSDIQGALSAERVFQEKYHCILYDAFSSKTTPTLWEEEFLNSFLKNVPASICSFSTYACRASLKRALKEQGFEVIIREGFQGKRNSTLAKKS